MTTNERALLLLEQNEHYESLNMFKQALNERRDVQSLNNLAWFYMHEGDFTSDDSLGIRDDLAIQLLEECILHKPRSQFPYQLLGEAYLRNSRWNDASFILKKSIGIYPTWVAQNNIGVAEYNKGNIEEAAYYYSKASSDHDYAAYSYAKCLIELTKYEDAKKVLKELPRIEEDLVGDLDVAQLYVEIMMYSEAATYYEKAWKLYWKQPHWVNRYIYSIYKLSDQVRIKEIINEGIDMCFKEIKETHEVQDDDWINEERETYITELQSEIDNYKSIVSRIELGYVPPIKFATSLLSDCYLFGCQRHGFLEYHTE